MKKSTKNTGILWFYTRTRTQHTPPKFHRYFLLFKLGGRVKFRFSLEDKKNDKRLLFARHT